MSLEKLAYQIREANDLVSQVIEQATERAKRIAELEGELRECLKRKRRAREQRDEALAKLEGK